VKIIPPAAAHVQVADNKHLAARFMGSKPRKVYDRAGLETRVYNIGKKGCRHWLISEL